MPSAWKEEETIRCGAQMLELLATKNYRSLVEPRVAAGFVGRLESRIEELRLQAGGKAATRSAQKASTLSQDEAAGLATELINKLRLLVRTGAPDDKTLWAAVGVGNKVVSGVGSVRKNLAKLIEGIVKNQNKALQVGILPTDLDAAREYAVALDDADSTQEGKKVESGLSTAAVKKLLVELKRDLTHLASIATVALPADISARFNAALPASGSGTKKKPATPA